VPDSDALFMFNLFGALARKKTCLNIELKIKINILESGTKTQDVIPYDCTGPWMLSLECFILE